MQDIFKINNLSEFDSIIKKIGGEDSHKKFVYRGQGDVTWPIDSSATRRIRTTVDDSVITYSSFTQYHESIVDSAIMSGYNTKDGRKLSQLEILANLQHFGAATCLIDYSYSEFKALWFACSGETESDGVVYCINQLDHELFDEVTSEQLQNYEIADFFPPNHLEKIWYWEPSILNKRILSQESLFIFGLPVLDKKVQIQIVIPKESKNTILNELRIVHKIHYQTIYNDFQGFALSHHHKMPFLEWNDEIYIEYAQFWLQQNDPIKSSKYINRALQFNPNNPEAMHLRGVILSNNELYQEALENLTNAIKLNPSNALNYNNRGTTYHRMELRNEAIADFSLAIQINPKLPVSYDNRGLVEFELGNYQKAINDCSMAILLQPSFAEAYFNRGNAYKAIDEPDNAMSDFNKAIELKPDYSDAYYNRGKLYFDKEDYDNALSDYSNAIKYNPTDILPYINRSNVNAYMGKFVDAFKDINKALSIDPNSVHAHYTKGHIFDIHDEKDQAFIEYSIVIENAQFDEDDLNLLVLSYSNRGVNLIEKGEKEKGCADMKMAFSLSKKQKSSIMKEKIEKIFEQLCQKSSD